MIKKYFTNHPGATTTDWLYHDSSFIKAIKYDNKQGTLYVKIGSKTYTYQVSLDTANGLSTATHWGQYYDEYIKGKSTKSNKVLAQLNQIMNVANKATVIKQSGVKVTQEKPIVTNPNDKALKDVLGTVWGGAQLALVFAPLPVATPLRLGIAAASIFAGSWLEAKGIEAPLAVDVAINLASGYGLYAGLKGIGTRAAKFSGLVKSPFVNVGYKAGVVKASVTPTQAVAGILFGGGKWKKAIVNMEQKVAETTAARSTAIDRLTKDFTINKILKNKVAPPLPGTQSKIFLTPTELRELSKLTEKVYKARKVGSSEKVLDFMLKNQKNISAGVAGGYTVYNTIKDINEHMTVKKQKKQKKKNKKKDVEEPKKFHIIIGKTGIEVATTILKH